MLFVVQEAILICATRSFQAFDHIGTAPQDGFRKLRQTSISRDIYCESTRRSRRWIHTTEDNFAAVRILLPKVQEFFRQQLGEEFHFSIPHRDDCFCWSTQQDATRHDQHALNAKNAFLNEEYNLTPDILLCSQQGFRVYRKQVMDETRLTR